MERFSVDAIARIVRSEIQDGLQPLQAQVSTLNSSMSVRMERVEGEMKSVKDRKDVGARCSDRQTGNIFEQCWA